MLHEDAASQKGGQLWYRTRSHETNIYPDNKGNIRGVMPGLVRGIKCEEQNVKNFV